MSRALVALIACVVLAAAGCGSDGDSAEPRADQSAGTETANAGTETANAAPETADAGGDTADASGEMADPRRGPLVKLRDSQFGPVLFGGRERALYLFTRDPRNRSRCQGACAEAWPPFYAKGRPRAGPGVDRSLLGTFERRDGRRQVTYKGRPLYFYVDDPRGEVLCNDVFEFGGTWYAVDAEGNSPA